MVTRRVVDSMLHEWDDDYIGRYICNQHPIKKMYQGVM